MFVPLFLWVIYACAIGGPYSGKAVGVAFAAGALTHVLLFIGYGFYKSGVIGNAGLLVYAVVIGFTPIILAVLGSRFFKPELLGWSLREENTSMPQKIPPTVCRRTAANKNCFRSCICLLVSLFVIDSSLQQLSGEYLL